MNLYNYSDLTIAVDGYDSVAAIPGMLQSLRQLTLEPTSGMNHELDSFARISQTRSVGALILTANTLDSLVGWALLSKEESDFVFIHSDNGFSPEDGMMFQVYVHPWYRKRGIASRLLQVARSKAGDDRLCVCPHDGPSYRFYDNFQHLEPKHL